jgi:hypothetical protein
MQLLKHREKFCLSISQKIAPRQNRKKADGTTGGCGQISYRAHKSNRASNEQQKLNKNRLIKSIVT